MQPRSFIRRAARCALPLLAGRAVVASDVAGTGPAGTEYRPTDLTDRARTREMVDAARPDLVFHLAGAGTPDADRCYAVNLGGTRNLLEACAALAAPPRVVVVSSAAVYGMIAPPVNVPVMIIITGLELYIIRRTMLSTIMTPENTNSMSMFSLAASMKYVLMA